MNLIFKSPPECPECQSKIIIHDSERMESYCAKCGLVLISNDFITLADIYYLKLLEKEANEKESDK